MAVNIHTGDLNQKVVFNQPTSSLNDEGGKELTYAPSLATWAAVFEKSQYRHDQANATVLAGAKDFYIRYAADRDNITKEWTITYKARNYVIHAIEQVRQDSEIKFLRFTAKSVQ